MRKLLRCYAERHQGRWEAFCVDFDIAVQGSSFEEVYHQLNVAVTDYIERVNELPSQDHQRLLRRRAPFWSRLRFYLPFSTQHSGQPAAMTMKDTDTRWPAQCEFSPILSILEGHGFELKRAVGSHRRYEGTVSRRIRLVTIAYHSLSEEIRPKTMASMIRQSRLPKRLFR